MAEDDVIERAAVHRRGEGLGEGFVGEVEEGDSVVALDDVAVIGGTALHAILHLELQALAAHAAHDGHPVREGVREDLVRGAGGGGGDGGRGGVEVPRPRRGWSCGDP